MRSTSRGGDREYSDWSDQWDSAGAGATTNRGADCGCAFAANHDGDD